MDIGIARGNNLRAVETAVKSTQRGVKMNKLLANALIIAGFTAATAVPVGAQTRTPPASDVRQATHDTRMRHRYDDKRPFSRPTERVEARLAYIKTALKITAAQQPLWDAFAKVARKQAAEREKRMEEWHARVAQSSAQREHRRPTAIERMEREQQFHTVAIGVLNERLEVEKPLYASLTSEQKQVADEVLVSRGRRG